VPVSGVSKGGRRDLRSISVAGAYQEGFDRGKEAVRFSASRRTWGQPKAPGRREEERKKDRSLRLRIENGYEGETVDGQALFFATATSAEYLGIFSAPKDEERKEKKKRHAHTRAHQVQEG